MTRTRTRAHIRAVSILAVGALLVAGGGVAQADNTVADGDGVVPLGDNNMSFGAIACGVPGEKPAPVAISRNGSATGTNTFMNGTTVTITVTSVDGAGLAAAVGVPNTITLPADWGDLSNNTMSAVVASTVTLTSTTPGIGNGKVSYRATGLNSDNHYITRDDDMLVTWTTGTCVAPNTPPTVSVGGVSDGASYPNGSVPEAFCLVTDAQDSNPSATATLSEISGPYALYGVGSQTASCTYRDGGGLTASSSVTYSIVDSSAPVIEYTLTPADPDGSNDWYTSDVSLTWTVTDPESQSPLVKTGCENQSITSDQNATIYTCDATSAGGTATQVSVSIKRDATAPVVVFTSASPGPNLAGWNSTDVTATFTATDALSGFGASSTATGTAATSGEGVGLTVGSPAFTDLAGNTAAAGAATSPAFKVDLSDPTGVVFVGGPAAGSSHYFGSVPGAPTCTADDVVSGLASCEVSGYSDLVGSHTLTATATDNAGRTATATRSFTVLAWTLRGFYQPVDMGGVWNTVKGGSTVPLKFEVFAGATELTSTSAVLTFKTQPVSCDSGSGLDDAIEILSTGGTSLRYDSTGGQFIQNWKTPIGAGKCYSATMTTMDGYSITALFKIR